MWKPFPKRQVSPKRKSKVCDVPLNKNTTGGTDKFVTTYYMRNPQGIVMAVYEKKYNRPNG